MIINEEKLSDGELSPSGTRALKTKQSKLSLQTRVSRGAKGKSKSASSDRSGLAKGKAKASETISILMESASRSGFGNLESRSDARFPLSTEPPVHGSSSGSVISLLATGPPPSILSDPNSPFSATPEISTRPEKRVRPDDAYEHSAGSTSQLILPPGHSTQSVISNLLSNPTVMKAALDRFLEEILGPDGSAEYCLDGVEGTLTFTPRSSTTSGTKES